MRPKQHLFIYDRKEVGVLVLLGTLVSIFAFTLGVHLGKYVAVHTAELKPQEAAPVTTQAEELPSQQEFKDQAAKAEQTADEALTQNLHDEVERTGIRLETPRQTDLPEDPRSKNAGATTLLEPRPADSSEILGSTGRRGKFTLQIGSFPSMSDAKGRLKVIRSAGLEPVVKPVSVNGERWYRVFLGDFSSKPEAEKAGEEFKSRHLFDSFIVAKLAE